MFFVTSGETTDLVGSSEIPIIPGMKRGSSFNTHLQ